MRSKTITLIVLIFFINQVPALNPGEKLIFRVCHACCLKDKKEVQAFVYKDMPNYDNNLVLEYYKNHNTNRPNLLHQPTTRSKSW